ncbi:MAG: homocysteine biosynthesis protein [Deferrisomatales bacterium]|nr:homocysteine biosynthesis protein [Deferrisomatales bacterium]
MPDRPPVQKTIAEINEKIRAGKAVVVTAEEMVDVVGTEGAKAAARRVDVVTTGTFGTMCSSGAFLNFGHTRPKMKAAKVWLNEVEAYAGVAAVDCYVGATQVAEDDPLNRVHPGRFAYGGGHVIEDLVAGRKVTLRATSYGTDCYPLREHRSEMRLADFRNALLVNPRNAYQNYNCAVNLSDRTIYTYMGVLRPRMANATFSSAGELSPLLNDPYYWTLGTGTRIFLGGAPGVISWAGTQHAPAAARNARGVPRGGAGTLMVTGDLKAMDPRFLRGASLVGYGTSLMVGLGVPIPVLHEELAWFTGVSNREITCPVVDYGRDYPQGEGEPLGEVTYADLQAGTIAVRGKDVPASPLSSIPRAREIAQLLKEWISTGRFTLGEPQVPLASVSWAGTATGTGLRVESLERRPESGEAADGAR